ncbi:hypothetical protein [Desulfonatronovibrio hydrogenovorans]|uniref:hypothetical protein n=1 Tax=Desulfonatronovibrio hydrogenovorans TaxID=53245 RepID=UPI0004921520|nr:hypothetical protein [Desulfonatronovibrio hydrogenovorans]
MPGSKAAHNAQKACPRHPVSGRTGPGMRTGIVFVLGGFFLASLVMALPELAVISFLLFGASVIWLHGPESEQGQGSCSSVGHYFESLNSSIHDNCYSFEQRSLAGSVHGAWPPGFRIIPGHDLDHMRLTDSFADSTRVDSLDHDDCMQAGVNPATGLPMMGCVDVHGNPYGTGESFHSSFSTSQAGFDDMFSNDFIHDDPFDSFSNSFSDSCGFESSLSNDWHNPFDD